MEKPETIPFFKFYIGGAWNIIIEVFDAFCAAMADAFLWIFGLWRCEHCNKYHGRRVASFTIRYIRGGDGDNYLAEKTCSLGINVHKPDPELAKLAELSAEYSAIISCNFGKSLDSWYKEWLEVSDNIRHLQFGIKSPSAVAAGEHDVDTEDHSDEDSTDI